MHRSAARGLRSCTPRLKTARHCKTYDDYRGIGLAVLHSHGLCKALPQSTALDITCVCASCWAMRAQMCSRVYQQLQRAEECFWSACGVSVQPSDASELLWLLVHSIEVLCANSIFGQICGLRPGFHVHGTVHPHRTESAKMAARVILLSGAYLSGGGLAGKPLAL